METVGLSLTSTSANILTFKMMLFVSLFLSSCCVQPVMCPYNGAYDLYPSKNIVYIPNLLRSVNVELFVIK